MNNMARYPQMNTSYSPVAQFPSMNTMQSNMAATMPRQIQQFPGMTSDYNLVRSLLLYQNFFIHVDLIDFYKSTLPLIVLVFSNQLS